MPRWMAVCTALFVTVLWSTSYILNKWAFAAGIGPFTLAGLRYAIAALALFTVRGTGRRVEPGLLPRYLGLGVAGYLVAQGFQYVGQYHVTPTQSGMVLSVGNTLMVLAAGFLWLRERPGALQGLGIALSVSGVSLFYYPFRLEGGTWLGIGMLALSGTGYAVQLTANR
ncbi:MAG TPA: DMT family transporter, partial [Symbiobacteriaceae bacterium]|nr:DMT family transporter [Symbiobacteriaceae bacterium]